MDKKEIMELLEKEPKDNTEYSVRREKLLNVYKSGRIPYAAKFERTHTLKQATELEVGDKTAICGRVVSKRSFGKFMFMNIQDVNAKMQISLSLGDLGEDEYKFAKNNIDVADFIGVSGEIYLTKTGELTVKCFSVKLLSKALRPLPEKWHGLEDTDLRYRQRYLDLIVNEEVRDVFIKRSKIISYIRNYLEENGFVEVETPQLQSVASGAVARPFITKHNTLDKDFYLRIAPELYLKQVVAGGFDRVFEIGKNFRNEGMDASHLQEFTMLEWYAAYWDFEDNIKFSEGLIKGLVQSVTGGTKIKFGDDEIEFGGDWTRIDYTKAMSGLLGEDVLSFTETAELKSAIESKNLLEKADLDKCKSVPSLIDMLFKRKLRPSIIQPTVLYNYPACLIPLARRNDENSNIIDMFQVVVSGWELMKAYSELVDPIIQREAFYEQLRNRNAGDDEAMDIDEAFVTAMEHGMPPMSGLGMGIDRLAAIICNQPTLRDVILFPLVK